MESLASGAESKFPDFRRWESDAGHSSPGTGVRKISMQKGSPLQQAALQIYVPLAVLNRQTTRSLERLLLELLLLVHLQLVHLL